MKKWLVLSFLFLWILGIAGCTTTTSTPNLTEAPTLIIISDGTKTLQSGDPVMFSRTITFTGQGPANAVIRIRQGETIIGTTTTDDAGSFTWSWDSGTTEGTFVFNFSAEVPDREESTPTSFTIVVDGTGPYLVSALAKADPPLGSAPTITVSFNEAIVVSDMNLFTLVPGGYWAAGAGGTSHFTLTIIHLADDQKTVTLSGNWMSDQLIAGDPLEVIFHPASPLVVTDKAGNPCTSPTLVLVLVSS
ncbi:hypothetical protein [Candidatus Sordicultor fermentans]|uniref:hypothetical protein n=1 Tax=Candidatus Sordicultor fermentans TaxID=1953203 RepID=UPI0016AFB0C1|nr:hypothetical protein [Candidatus Atribacteria bacterium]